MLIRKKTCTAKSQTIAAIYFLKGKTIEFTEIYFVVAFASKQAPIIQIQFK